MNPFQINRDRSIDQDKVFLVDKRFRPIQNGEIYPISDLQIVANLNSNWECQFTVYRETDGIPNPLWEQITDLALVKIENRGIFELEAPVTDEASTYKSCSGKSICEAETSQTTMTLEINTEDDIARESKTDPTATYYKEFPTLFYRDIQDTSVFDNLNGTDNAAKLQSLSENEKKEILRRSSLLHRVFSEMPEYAANINGDNIDDSLKNLQYILSWSDTSVYDICQDIAEEIQCIFIFDKFHRSFEVRDLKDHCEIDGCRDIQDGICPICQKNGTTQKITSFGEYSGVEIDTHNLAETINLSGNKDSVKNYFKIEGADDVITNRISNRLIGNGYLWKTGALQRSQMSPELVAALEEREKMMAAAYPAGSKYQNLQDEYDQLWDHWNALNLQKANYESGMMPSPEMADKNAEYVFHSLFGTNGKIHCAYASNRFQTETQIADSVMRYAKLLTPTNHTIEYKNLSYQTTKWNDQEIVASITFQVHIYLDGHYKEDEEEENGTKKYADEYPSSDTPAADGVVTLPVVKGYDITCTKEDDKTIYTNDYYNYLKHLVDMSNAEAGITEESILFEPITPADIAPEESSYQGNLLKATHYSKYCYKRLQSFYDAYESCSSVVSQINPDITSNTDEAIPSEEVKLSLEKIMESGKNYFVIPLQPDLSYIQFQKDVIYQFTIKISDNKEFSSEKIGGLLAASGNINPGGHGLHAYKSQKSPDKYYFYLFFKGDGKSYSHLCIALPHQADYSNSHSYNISATIPPETPDSPSEIPNLLEYLRSDGETGNIQKDLLGKYQLYMTILSERMRWLQEQITEIMNKQESCMDRINEIKDTCDMENCLKRYAHDHGINHNLWYELCSFKRQDTYRNDNFFGEGVNDAKLMEYVENLLKRAEEEIESACNITYSASATISNLLTMPEFEPFWDKFTLGNYIHMLIDDQVHTMRLTSITYDYADLSHCSVEFSDVIRKTKNKTEEIADILSQASSLASTAKTTARQAEQGAAAKLSVDVIKKDALNLANSRIITADDQNFVIDRYGITGKYIDPLSGDVSDEQIRMINNLLCFTDDNWQHTKTALGKITYWNPDTVQYETKYGLIGDTIIGNLLLGEKLTISDQNGYVRIDGNGILTNNENGVSVAINPYGTHFPKNPGKNYLFSIAKNDELIMGISTEGNGYFSGNILGSTIESSEIISGSRPYSIELKDGILSCGNIRICNGLLNYHTNQDKYINALNFSCDDYQGEFGFRWNTDGSVNMISPKERPLNIGEHNYPIHDIHMSGSINMDGSINMAGSINMDGSINMAGGSLYIPTNTSTYETENTEKIRVATEKAIPNLTILSGENNITVGQSYLGIPLQSDLSSFQFQKDSIYQFTISTSASYGFWSSSINGLLAVSENVNPGSDGLRSFQCEKIDSHHFVISFKGDGKAYSHLYIALSNESDYDYGYLYQFQASISIQDSTVAISPNKVKIYGKEPDSQITSELDLGYNEITFSQGRKTGKLSLNNEGALCSSVNLYAPNLEWSRIASDVTSYAGDLSAYNEIRIIMKCGDSMHHYSFNLIGKEITANTKQYLEGYDNGSYTGVGSINISTSEISIGQCRVGSENLSGYLTIYVR